MGEQPDRLVRLVDRDCPTSLFGKLDVRAGFERLQCGLRGRETYSALNTLCADRAAQAKCGDSRGATECGAGDHGYQAPFMALCFLDGIAG